MVRRIRRLRSWFARKFVVAEKRPILVVGHRGWLARYPENTIVGFRAAIDLGVDFLELDVHVSADRHLVVIHDEDLRRTTGVRGSVRRLTLTEIKRLDAGRWFSERFAGQRIPTLEEVMALAQGRVGLAIEVKPPDGTARALDEKLIPLARQFKGPLVVHSFDFDYIRDFKLKAPEIRTGYLCYGSVDSVHRATAAGAEAIHPAARGWTARLAARARKKGLGVMIWAARNRRDCLRMMSKDTDAIGTDCPDVLIQMLKEHGMRQ